MAQISPRGSERMRPVVTIGPMRAESRRPRQAATPESASAKRKPRVKRRNSGGVTKRSCAADSVGLAIGWLNRLANGRRKRRDRLAVAIQHGRLFAALGGRRRRIGRRRIRRRRVGRLGVGILGIGPARGRIAGRRLSGWPFIGLCSGSHGRSGWPRLAGCCAGPGRADSRAESADRLAVGANRRARIIVRRLTRRASAVESQAPGAQAACQQYPCRIHT